MMGDGGGGGAGGGGGGGGSGISLTSSMGGLGGFGGGGGSFFFDCAEALSTMAKARPAIKNAFFIKMVYSL